MSRRNDIDWEKIETLYRLGQLSVRDIAANCGVQHSTIVRRAKAAGWVRDLSDQVRRETKAALIRGNAPRTSDAPKEAPSPTRAEMDSAVRVNVAVQLSHRADVKDAKDIVRALLGQLKEALGSREALEDTVVEMTEPGPRRAAMLRAVSLPAHAGVVRDLTAALKNLIPLERQAYSMDDAIEVNSYEEMLDRALADAPAGVG